MKAVYDNLFCDLDHGNIADRERLCEKLGEEIKTDLEKIKEAIKNYDLKEAFELIERAQQDY